VSKIKGIEKIKEEINNLTKYRKEHADTFGEVFTDFYLIEDHVSNINPELFKDPKSTFLDPCAGFGSYSIILIERLMDGLKEWEPDPERRYKHILENQIFMVEIQKESCDVIERLFNKSGKYRLNLYNMSFLDFDPKVSKIESSKEIKLKGEYYIEKIEPPNMRDGDYLIGKIEIDGVEVGNNQNGVVFIMNKFKNPTIKIFPQKFGKDFNCKIIYHKL